MAVRLALTSSAAAKLLAVAAVAGVAGGGYTLASWTSNDTASEHVNAAASHANLTHSPDADETTEAVSGPSSDSSSSAADDSSESKATPSSTPSPSLHGLCNAFLAHHEDNPTNWQNSAAFQVLIKAAGGSAQATVKAFCDALPPKAQDSRDASEEPSEATDEPSEHATKSAHPHATVSRTPDADETESDAPDAETGAPTHTR